MSYTDLDHEAINTIRFLAVDAVQKANSGHPGMPMGAAPMAYVLWTRFLKFNPRDPNWPNRDRFLLSAGHGSMLLYSLLHLTGYDMPMEQLKNFRQWNSITPGHPENHLAPGVEVTTGPLGQGFGNGVGMAIAERHIAAHFNRDDYDVMDHYTYAIVSDGDLMEGVASEAASLAGHLGLGKLIYLYDDNHISIDGSTNLAFTEDAGKRFEAYGWHVQRIDDGNDLEAIERAISAAQNVDDQPSIILVRTHIGYGSPNKQDTAEVHGSPLGEDEVVRTKRALDWPEDKKFYVPDDVREYMLEAMEQGQTWQSEWEEMLGQYSEEYPELRQEWDRWWSGTLPDDWDVDVPAFDAGSTIATRKSGGAVLNAIAQRVTNLVGGSADLTPSNKTDFDGAEDFQRNNYEGRYFRFGVREHAMGAALNGMALHGGLIPFGGTFLIFSDYMRPSVRLAALSGAHVIYVYTHDSVFLGEDGPTHQPVEHLASLRAMPNIVVLRPGDANEVAEAWRVAMQQKSRPVAFSLTRQGVETLDRTKYASADGVRKGAYVLADNSDGTPELILLATGSEVPLVVKAYEQLVDEGIAARVVSMPSWELFQEQSQAYRDEVLPPAATKRLAVEAGASLGWDRWIGPEGDTITIDRFGASAPWKDIARHLGFTVENVVAKAKALLK